MSCENNQVKNQITNWLQPFLNKQNLKNYTIEVLGNTEKGDGYLGDVTFVKVNGKRENNEEKTYNFVIKSAKKNIHLRQKFPIRSLFENEIYFYNKIIPTFVQFQKEKGVEEPFDNVTKCYHTMILEDDMEILVLENLKSIGYDLWNRKHPMNKEHIRTIIKTYSKLHAISFALRDQKPEVFKKLVDEMPDAMKSMRDSMKPSEVMTLFNDIIACAKEQNDIETAEKIQQFQNKNLKMEDIHDPEDPNVAILHGDCWNNNFMFKYQDDQKTVSKVCMLDFQLSRVAPPVFDLSYFLFTCLSEEDVNNFDEILQLYYESFSDFLKQLGSDPNKLFTFEQFLTQWKKYGRFGLYLMCSLIRICLSEKDEVADLTAAAEADTDFIEAFKYSIKNIQGYGKRTLPVMKLAIDKEYI